ncbi:MAG: hypothetical protein RLZZ262_227 [Bacteroidota bacterium]|jgi:hypothetical protein
MCPEYPFELQPLDNKNTRVFFILNDLQVMHALHL